MRQGNNVTPIGSYSRLFDLGFVKLLHKDRTILKSCVPPVQTLLNMHCSGDWGAVDFRQEESNFNAIRFRHAPIISNYTVVSADGVSREVSVVTDLNKKPVPITLLSVLEKKCSSTE